MNKPITLCDRCKEYAHCCLNYDGYNCQKNRTVEPMLVEILNFFKKVFVNFISQ